MKIIYKQSLVEYIEELNETHPIKCVEISHCDAREVRRVFDTLFHGQGPWIDDNNHADIHYPGCSGEITMNGITYIPMDNTEDFR